MPLVISADLLKRFAPRCDAATLAPALDAAATRHFITSRLRVCHWLAQLAEETGGFTVFSENLNYSAGALEQQWPRHFTHEQALAYARQPERIANRAYANRMGNGDEASGDGWRYRGRGLLQITGKAAYQQIGLSLGLDLVGNPDLMLQPAVSAEAAALFWEQHGCNGAANRDDIVEVTRIVNGGLLNLDHRKQQLAAAKAIFTDESLGLTAAPMTFNPPPPFPHPLEDTRSTAAPGSGRVTVFAQPHPTLPPVPPLSDEARAAIFAEYDRKTAGRPAIVAVPTTPNTHPIKAAAPAIASGASGAVALAGAASSWFAHIDFARVFVVVAEVAAIAAVPLVFWGIWRGLRLLHVSLEAKARGELLAILARGAAVARQAGQVENGAIAAAAAAYAVKAAPGLIHELGVAPTAAPAILTNMALALLPAPEKPA